MKIPHKKYNLNDGSEKVIIGWYLRQKQWNKNNKEDLKAGFPKRFRVTREDSIHENFAESSRKKNRIKWCKKN